MTHLHPRLTLVALRRHLQTEWGLLYRRPMEWDRRHLLLTGWRRLRPKTEEPLRCACV